MGGRQFPSAESAAPPFDNSVPETGVVHGQDLRRLDGKNEENDLKEGESGAYVTPAVAVRFEYLHGSPRMNVLVSISFDGARSRRDICMCLPYNFVDLYECI